ncbi:unnamed protein product [Effrenium voratum]|uniref:C3H1-type domain-containing protein n=1 Tax=Effrenium voratum TaxID=2562239 RepID=A0AA36JBD9_9DINO|nr:unnamed protein product [Effrenium voratum]
MNSGGDLPDFSLGTTQLEFRHTFLSVPEEPARHGSARLRSRSEPVGESEPLEAAVEFLHSLLQWQAYASSLPRRLQRFGQPEEERSSSDGSQAGEERSSDGDVGNPGEPCPDEAAPLESIGSLGHPDLCRSACVFVIASTCYNGANCPYCHLPHDEKRAKLDKRQRGWLRELSEAQLLPILLQHLRARAENKGFAQQADGLIRLLAEPRMTFFQLLRLAPQEGGYGQQIAQAVLDLRSAM